MRVATCVLCVCILVHAKQLVLQVSTLRIRISTYVAEPSQGKSQPLTKPKPGCTFVSLNLSSLYFSVHVVLQLDRTILEPTVLFQIMLYI